MTECTSQFELFSIGRRRVTAAFDGGRVTSDAGVLFLKRIDERLRLTDGMASALEDRRQPGKVEHPLGDLLRQRIFQICCGWEDANDSDTLRFDPGFQTALNHLPGYRSGVLASQPTISRLEEKVRRRDLMALSRFFLELFIQRLRQGGRKAWKKIILDFDSTDDPTHGSQQLTMFHGYYDQWQYLPLLVFHRGWPVAAALRPGNAHDSWGALALLRRIAQRLWEQFPKAEILLRADAGLAVPEIYEFCEAAQILYIIGQAKNPRLIRKARPLLKKARARFEETGEKAKLFGSFRHRADSWPKARRIIVKAEVLPLGDNPRFLVTSLTGDPASLYQFYVDRGAMENHIKDLKNALRCDRLSCQKFLSNQFRLLLHTAAYILMFSLREALKKTSLASVQMDTLRLRLLKIAAKVVTTARRVWFHLASSHPSAPLWQLLATRLARAPA